MQWLSCQLGRLCLVLLCIRIHELPLWVGIHPVLSRCTPVVVIWRYLGPLAEVLTGLGWRGGTAGASAAHSVAGGAGTGVPPDRRGHLPGGAAAQQAEGSGACGGLGCLGMSSVVYSC